VTDDFACEGDDPEIESLHDHSELGDTPETRIEMSAAMAMGISDRRVDYAP
jgi:hypothetical protein